MVRSGRQMKTYDKILREKLNLEGSLLDEKRKRGIFDKD